MNKVKGYRNTLNETQQEWADMLSISRVSYISKENKKTPFTDKEKVIIRNHISKKIPGVTIDDLFF